MEKIIQTLIDSWTKGVDTYTHNGSTWLIFTANKQWVIELTESKTLWYNYNFFKQIFEFTSMDVVENQQYITKWVENNIINGSKNTPSPAQTPSHNMEEVLENGSIDSVRVNEYSLNYVSKQRDCEDTIENGVNETSKVVNHFSISVEDTIERGVKKTKGAKMKTDWSVEDTLENGVRHTDILESGRTDSVEDTLQNGVKKTNSTLRRTLLGVDDIIQNGIRNRHFIYF